MDVKDYPIIKYMDSLKFMDLVGSCRLPFSHIEGFEDKWEGTTSDHMISKTLGNSSIDERLHPYLAERFRTLPKCVWISCWSQFGHESIAMWDLYARLDGVAIVSSREKLENVVLQSNFDSNPTSDSTRSSTPSRGVELVKYDRDDPEHSKPVYLSKRKAFEHEKEVRAYFVGSSSHIETLGKVFYVPILPAALIDRILVSPRAEVWHFEAYRKLLDSAGFASIDLARSAILGAPDN